MSVATAAVGKAAVGAGGEPRVGLCRTLDELYAPPARRAMAVLLETWLTRQNATPFELLHSPELARRLENSGSDLQQALQKVAVPAAVERGASVHEVIRGLHKLFDQGVARLYRLRGAAAPVPLTPETVAQAAALAAESDANGAFGLGCALAAALTRAESWAAKLDLVLDLAAAPVDEPAAALAAAVLEQPLQEILDAPAAQGELFGAEVEAGEMLLARLALAEAAAFAAVGQAKPALVSGAAPLSPQLKRLGEALAAGRFPGVRRSLNRRALADFAGHVRLNPKDAPGEIELLRLIAVLLTAAAGSALPDEEVREAIVKRSQTLLESQFITALVGPQPEPLAEMVGLVRILENVAGQGNRVRAVRLLEHALATRRLQRLISESAKPESYGDPLLRLRHRIVRAASGVTGVDRLLEELAKLDALTR